MNMNCTYARHVFRVKYQYFYIQLVFWKSTYQPIPKSYFSSSKTNWFSYAILHEFCLNYFLLMNRRAINLARFQTYRKTKEIKTFNQRSKAQKWVSIWRTENKVMWWDRKLISFALKFCKPFTWWNSIIKPAFYFMVIIEYFAFTLNHL